MSLINNMLRDLETRKRQGGDATSLGDNPTAVNTPAYRSRKLLFGCLLLLLIGVSGFVLLQYSEVVPDEPDNSQTVSLQLNEAVVNLEKPSFESAADSIGILRPLIPLVVAEPPVETKEENVFENNDAVMLSAIFMSEEGNSAQVKLDFARIPAYRLVQNGSETEPLVFSFNDARLGADFDLPDMQKGAIRNISLRPLKDSLQLLIYMKDQMLVQGLQVVEMGRHGYQLLIELERSSGHVKSTVDVVSSPPPVVETTTVLDPLLAPVVVGNVEKVNKKADPVALDRQAFLLGMKAIQQHNLDEAQVAFEQAININPRLTDARMQLIDLLLVTQQIQKAEVHLRQGLSVSANNIPLRKQFVRFLLQHQRPLEAIELLQSIDKPSMAEDLEYHALLAASLQESGQFEQAGELYGQLVNLRPQQAVWWMGLAISMDQSGHNDQAKMAYGKAVALPGLRPDLHKYIQSRLQVL
jgi:Tfp pilus assembly protein PilF